MGKVALLSRIWSRKIVAEERLALPKSRYDGRVAQQLVFYLQLYCTKTTPHLSRPHDLSHPLTSSSPIAIRYLPKSPKHSIQVSSKPGITKICNVDRKKVYNSRNEPSSWCHILIGIKYLATSCRRGSQVDGYCGAGKILWCSCRSVLWRHWRVIRDRYSVIFRTLEQSHNRICKRDLSTLTISSPITLCPLSAAHIRGSG